MRGTVAVWGCPNRLPTAELRGCRYRVLWHLLAHVLEIRMVLAELAAHQSLWLAEAQYGSSFWRVESFVLVHGVDDRLIGQLRGEQLSG